MRISKLRTLFIFLTGLSIITLLFCIPLTIKNKYLYDTGKESLSISNKYENDSSSFGKFMNSLGHLTKESFKNDTNDLIISLVIDSIAALVLIISAAALILISLEERKLLREKVKKELEEQQKGENQGEKNLGNL